MGTCCSFSSGDVLYKIVSGAWPAGHFFRAPLADFTSHSVEPTAFACQLEGWHGQQVNIQCSQQKLRGAYENCSLSRKILRRMGCWPPS